MGAVSRRLGAVLLAGAAALGLAACGSSAGSGHAASSHPQTLLRQTFAASHAVKSGVLDFRVVITPHGSSIASLDLPLTLSLDGPFQSRGKGKEPESAFTIGLTGLGRHGSFGVRTTSHGGYVSLEGDNFALPAADSAKLSSTIKGGSGSQAPGLSTLGIDPESWLRDPKVVGTQTVDGVRTEHLHAGLNVPAFVRSLDKLLAKESRTLGRSKQITPTTTRKIVNTIRDPSVDVYTGASDSTLRRLVVSATLPVTGTISTRLGGLTSAGVRLSLDYSQLNQPQTIAAPTNVRSYAALQAKLRTLGAALESELGDTSSTTAPSTTAPSTTAPATGSTGNLNKYSRCINGAHGDVTKMQKCATLLNSGG